VPIAGAPVNAMRLHASCVALDGRGLLILGKSGSGKSRLALELMAYGAALVSDDQTIITARNGRPYATAPAPLRGLIEARGFGLLAAETEIRARLILAIDLDRTETDRLPPDRSIDLPGGPLPLLHRTAAASDAASLLQYLKGARVDT